MPRDGSVCLKDITSQRAVINLCGPKARDILGLVCDDDVTNDGFKFLAARQIDIGMAPVLAIRITYVGELGWELHVPSEFAQQVFETLMAAEGAPRLCGGMAVDSCRIEKGFRHWGHDIGPHDSPVESGLTFACDFSTDFTGKAAIENRKGDGAASRLLSFRLDDPEALVFGKEPILCDGEIVGRLTSASYGWTMGGPVGMGYVSRPAGMKVKDLAARAYYIVVAGRAISAQASLRPLYDPANERLERS